MKRSAITLPIALLASALALRPQVIGVGPLIPEIQVDLDISHTEAGLLGTLPVLCMGLFAPPAPYLLGRLGTRWAITLCLGLIAVFGLARVLVPAPAAVIALTVGVGVGMGLAGALMPIATKEAARPQAGLRNRDLLFGDPARRCSRGKSRRSGCGSCLGVARRARDVLCLNGRPHRRLGDARRAGERP
ncbi:MAG: MFS transporter [Actinomycetia bacterium]|nr:MFS transporter [Actinomycetes bacterium]